MNEDIYIELIWKEADATITEEEAETLREWLAADPAHEQQKQDVLAAWHASPHLGAMPELDMEVEFQALQGRLAEDENSPVIPFSKPSFFRRKSTYALAASLLLLCLAGIWAAAYFGGGRGEIVVETNSSPQSHTLPDGSIVDLAPHSRISYSNEFNKTQRTLELEGKARFQVTSNPDKPFSVNALRSRTTVLGTVFTIRSEKEMTGDSLIVEEGMVSFGKQDGDLILKVGSGENAFLDAGSGSINLATNPVPKPAGKLLEFKDAPLREVLSQIEALFSVEIDLGDAGLADCPLTMKIITQDPRAALEMVAAIFGMELRQRSDKAYNLEGGACG